MPFLTKSFLAAPFRKYPGQIIYCLGPSTIETPPFSRPAAPSLNSSADVASADDAFPQGYAKPSATAEQPYTSPVLFKMLDNGPPWRRQRDFVIKARIITIRFSLKHFSSGDALRGHITEGTQLGKEAKGFMDKGELVPDNLLVDVVLAHVVDVEAKTNRWLLDGFPRTVNQAKALDEVHLSVDEQFHLADV
eukprot:jgi/Bigna1/80189/fgenesh1_pg.68_\